MTTGYGSTQQVISGDKAKAVRKIVYIGLLINVSLATIKFLAGYFGASQALIADAMHSFTDAISDILVIVGSFFWSKPPDANHPHGHQRIETLVTLLIGVFIIFAGASMAWHSITSIELHRSVHNPSLLALITVIIAIVAKEILCRWTLHCGRKLYSTALIANAWEHRSDVLSSFPVFGAILGSMLFHDLGMLDNIGAIIVAIFIVNTGLKIFLPRLKELLEQGAPIATINNIKNIIEQQPGVIEAHKIRSRYLSANLLLDLHMVVAADLTMQQAYDINMRVRKTLLQQFPELLDVIIHLEPDSTGLGMEHQD